MKLGGDARTIGHLLHSAGDVRDWDGRSGNVVGGGVGGRHGDPVLELHDVHERLALDGGAIKGVWAGDGEVASRVAAAGCGGGGDVCHGEASRWAEAEELVRWAGSAVSVQRTVDSGDRTAWLNQQPGL